MSDHELLKGFDDLFLGSNKRTLIPARLGVRRGEEMFVSIPGNPREWYISLGIGGEDGDSTATDAVGVDTSQIGQQIWVRKELGKWVIYRASFLAGGGSGGSSTLDALTDVTTAGKENGDLLQWDSSVGQWVPFTPTGTTGGAPSPHTLSGIHHTAGSTLADGQAPQFLMKDGSRELEGNLGVAPSIEIDGVDISEHAYNSPDAHHNRVSSANAGITVSTGNTQVITLNLANINPALWLEPDGVRVLDYHGLKRDGNGLSIHLRSTADGESGLHISAEGLTLRDDVAGNGLVYGSGNRILAVGAGVGILSDTDSVRVNQAFSPVWTGVHQFNQTPLINSNLHFMGGDRYVTASNSLRLTPTTDLWLDPGGLIILPTPQELKTELYNDFVTGIEGLQHSLDSGVKRRLTIAKIKADELHVRVFSADEQRVSRGAEFWSRSFGIVEEDFIVPARGATVDVWFEEAPDLGNFALFIPNNWLEFRTIDVTTGLITQNVWFQVVDGDASGTNNYISRQAQTAPGVTPSHVARQQWRLVRRSGGILNMPVRKGNVGVEFGLPLDYSGSLYLAQSKGQGVVHLSALEEDDGPFVQIQVFDSVIDDGTNLTPHFSNKVRMGNLEGTLGYTVPTWGFAAGNDLSIVPSSGNFKGAVLEANSGLALYNTDINIYDAATLVVQMDDLYGLRMVQDQSDYGKPPLYVSWYTNLDGSGINRGYIGSYLAGGNTSTMRIVSQAPGGSSNWASIDMSVSQNTPVQSARFIMQSGNILDGNSLFQLVAQRMYVDTDRAVFGTPSGNEITSTFVVYENTVTPSAITGLTIEQAGVSDSVLHWRLIPGNKYYSMGIDNNDGDKFKISASAILGTSDFFVYDPVTGLVTVSGLTGGPGGGGGTYTAGSGITITGTEIAVDASVVRTTRMINTGAGLLGGSSLDGDINLSVDTGAGITIGVSGVQVHLLTNSGLNTDSGLAVDASLAGTGMSLVTGVLNVNALSTGGLETGANEIHIKVSPTSASGVDTNANGLYVKRRNLSAIDSGIAMSLADGLYLADTVAGAGLEWTTTTERILQLSLGGGLEFNQDPVTATAQARVMLPADSGLLRDGTGIYIDPAIANLGLVWNAGKINVGAGNGITVGTDVVAIKLRTISPGSGLSVDADGLRIQRRDSLGVNSGIAMNVTDGVYLADSVAGAGLEWKDSVTRELQASLGGGLEFNDLVGATDATVRVKLPVPSGLLRDTTGIHLDPAIAGAGMTMSASKQLNVIAANASLIVAPDAMHVNLGHNWVWIGSHTFNTGQVTFNTTPNVSANLHFIAANRSITTGSTYDLTLAPGGDLFLDPAGLIFLPTAQELKTPTFSDNPTGILGMRLFQRTDIANYRQLTIGAFKADELYVRVFVADETRIDRGEEFWSKGYGVVETDSDPLPAINGTFLVWFENAVSFSGNIFDENDWLLFRTIDFPNGGLLVQKIWCLVDEWIATEAPSPGHDLGRQQWKLIRRNGGTTGQNIKKGNVALNMGTIGQGAVHLSALVQDDGPFIQFGNWLGIDPYNGLKPFTNYVRIGKLSGTVDYTGNEWGLVAGNNIGSVPDDGFSGLTADNIKGLRLFNTSLAMYTGTNKDISLTTTNGLVFDIDTAEYANPTRYIGWWADVDTFNPLSHVYVGAYAVSGINRLVMRSKSNNANSMVQIFSEGNADYSLIDIRPTQVSLIAHGIDFLIGTIAGAYVPNPGKFGVRIANPISPAHVYEDTSTTGITVGLTVEQAGSGDAQIQFLLTGVRRWTMGADNSALGDPLRISASGDLSTNPLFSLASTGELVLFGSDTTQVLRIGSLTLTEGANTFATGFFRHGSADQISVHVIHSAPTAAAFASGISGETFRSFLISADGTLQWGSGLATRDVSLYRSGAGTLRTDANVIIDGSLTSASLSTGSIVSASLRAASASGLRLEDDGGNLGLFVEDLGFVGVRIANPVSPLHIYENTGSTGATTGLTVEQAGSGDAALQFYITDATQYWSLGIDNSAAGDPFKIAPAADLASHVFHLTTAGLLTVSGLAATTLAISGAVTLSSTLAVTGATTLSSTLNVSGASTLASPVSIGTGVGTSTLIVDGGATSLRQFLFRSAGSARWIWQVDAVAETGGNVGSDLALLSRDDTGASLSSVVITVDRASGNVGIGKVAATSAKLDVVGALHAPTVRGGTGSNGNLTVEGTSHATKTTSYLLLQPTGGLVGIGTSTPTVLLHLLSSATTGTQIRVEDENPGTGSGGLGYANMRVQNQAGNFFQFTAWGENFAGSDLGTTRAGKGMLIWGGAGTATEMVVGTNFASALGFSTNAARRMTILSTGQVGIGTATPIANEAYSRLTVQASDATQNSMSIENTGAGQTALILRRTGTTPSRWQQYIPAGSDALSWYSATLANNVLTMNSSGYVGIGVDAPGNWLDVQGEGLGISLNRSTLYGNGAFHFLGRRALGSKASPTKVTNGTPLMSLGGLGYTDTSSGGSAPGWHTTVSAEMRIVATEDYTAGTSTGLKGGAEIQFWTRNDGAAGYTSLPRVTIRKDGALVVPYVVANVLGGMTVTVDADGILSKASSSRRYKDSVQALAEDAYTGLFDSLRPVTYRLKAGAGKVYAGLIAEEVHEAGGQDFVIYDKDGQPDALMYDQMIVLLIMEMRRLKREVREMKETRLQ